MNDKSWISALKLNVQSFEPAVRLENLKIQYLMNTRNDCGGGCDISNILLNVAPA